MVILFLFFCVYGFGMLVVLLFVSFSWCYDWLIDSDGDWVLVFSMGVGVLVGGGVYWSWCWWLVGVYMLVGFVWVWCGLVWDWDSNSMSCWMS